MRLPTGARWCREQWWRERGRPEQRWREQSVSRWLGRRWRQYAAPRRVDLLIAGGLLVWGLPDVPWWWEHPGHRDTLPAILGALALTLVMSVPFCWRRRSPFLVLLAAAAVLAARGALHHDPVSAFAAVLVAAYGVGSYGRASRRFARGLGWAALAGAVLVVLTSHGQRLSGAPLALLGAAFVVGDAASARRAESAAAIEAAHQAERTRIARDLHDVVAHQLSAIAVQAGTARLAAAGSPDPAVGPNSAVGRDPVRGPDPVIGTVEQLAREALAELNHLLGALRREPDASPARPPAPTLADLDGLLAAGRAAGTAVNLAVEGPARPLPAGAELSVYRIVQEALANVARHAPHSPAQVTLRYGAGELRVEVVNAAPADGPRATALVAGPAGGRGVRGMRERAELYGGQLHAAPRPGGGFAVTAIIPCDRIEAAVPG
jgi:signal transduction histidine kinase